MLDYLLTFKNLNSPSTGEHIMIHLTETGYNAGRLFCLNTMSDTDTKAHGAYAPLHLADFRGKCCSDCLKVWALEAYDDTDTDAPDWVLSIRNKQGA